MTEVKKFVVSRSRWCRGTDDACLRLYEGGTQCCLGFVGEQVNVPGECLLGVPLPDELDASHYALYPELKTGIQIPEQGFEWFDREKRIDDWTAFSFINDDRSITDQEREKRLQALAQLHGFEFEFVD